MMKSKNKTEQKGKLKQCINNRTYTRVVDNEMKVKFLAIPQNEQLARMLVSAFIAPVNPTMNEFDDVKTAISEAVTNAIIHGYPKKTAESKEQYIYLHMKMLGNRFCVTIKDHGIGIADLTQAMQPMYTSKPELERSGMGFSFMEAFMSELQVESKLGKGTTVYMEKEFGQKEIDG